MSQLVIYNWSCKKLKDQLVLTGFVSGHPTVPDGNFVNATSPIVGIVQKHNQTFALTKTGSEYRLGFVSTEHETSHPNAREGLIKLFSKG
jgi:hypothetical protein